MCSNERRIYTLEEFEKEFPFKIGDEVITNDDRIGIIEKLIPGDISAYCVKINKVSYWSTPTSLRLYKEMNKERNITLTLEKAKEWYQKGGELKEVALQAFTEKELNPLPRSWEEFATNYARMGYYISADGKPLMCASSGKLSSPHVCQSIKSAEAHLAMIQLEQLRNCWRQNWKPDWNDDRQCKYCILRHQEFKIQTNYTARRFLSFPTREMAEEFLKCFRDLIEKAEDLI